MQDKKDTMQDLIDKIHKELNLDIDINERFKLVVWETIDDELCLEIKDNNPDGPPPPEWGEELEYGFDFFEGSHEYLFDFVKSQVKRLKKCCKEYEKEINYDIELAIDKINKEFDLKIGNRYELSVIPVQIYENSRRTEECVPNLIEVAICKNGKYDDPEWGYDSGIDRFGGSRTEIFEKVKSEVARLRKCAPN